MAKKSCKDVPELKGDNDSPRGQDKDVPGLRGENDSFQGLGEAEDQGKASLGLHEGGGLDGPSGEGRHGRERFF